MASTKISQLTEKTVPAGTEELVVNDSGVSKKIKISNLPDNDTTYSVGDGGLTEVNFTSAKDTKLTGIETGATADQTGAEIKTAYEAEANTNAFTDADHSKLDGIEASANNYSHPATHSISEVSGLQTALDGKTTESYVDNEIANLVDSAPATLDTLNELSAALGDDANFSTTVTNSIATKLPLAGGTLTGNLSLGDNVKAQFGASNDLQIYHDGFNSYISDTGTGNLYIDADSSLVVRDQSSGEKRIETYSSGQVALYYAGGNKKLSTTSTGIDVTGQVVADSFGLDANDRIEWSNNAYLRFIINGGEEARLESDGDFHADGDVIAYSTTISDKNLKKDIKPIEDALNKVNKLNGCTFTYTSDNMPSAGLIAQDVEEVLPSAVRTKKLVFHGEEGKEYKTLQYDQTIGLLVEAIKELSAKVDLLESN